MQKEREFKEVDSRFDEEHNLWEVRFVNSQGAEQCINWELASTPEYRQMISKYKQIDQYHGAAVRGRERGQGRRLPARKRRMSEAEARRRWKRREAKKTKPPSRAKSKAGEPVVEKTTARELFEYVLNEGSKDYIVQRYKGLGEMTAAAALGDHHGPRAPHAALGEAGRHRRDAKPSSPR